MSGTERTVEQIHEEFRKSNAAFSKNYQAAKTDEERRSILAARPSSKDFVVEIKPLLLARADDPEIVASVAYVLYVSRTKNCEELVELVARYRQSEYLAGALLIAPYDKSGRLTELRDWAREESPHENVKAVAAFLRGSLEKSLPQKEKISELNFAKNYAGDLNVLGIDIKKLIAPILFEASNLAIGKTAPEIEGEDVDGELFKLSSHRGKVVVLTFWGDW